MLKHLLHVPRLRFRGFSDEWRTRTLNNLLLSFRLGGNYANSDIKTDHPLIKMGNLGRGNFNLNKVQYISKGQIIDPKDRIKHGDLFFNTRNTLELVGKVSIWKSELPVACYNSNLMRLQFDCNNFMNYYLNSFHGLKKLKRLATGTTSVAAIYTRDLLKIRVITPSVDEQKKIAEFLGVVDDRVSALTHKKIALQKYKKGVMQQIFSQKIRFTDKTGNPYPDWDEKGFGDITSINPSSKNLPNEFAYIDLESVSQGRLLREKMLKKASAPSRAQRLLQRKDILFQTVRPYQRNNYFFNLDGIYVASTGYAQIRASVPGFIYQLIHTDDFVNSVLDYCTGTNYPAINSNDLAKVAVKIPSSEQEQQKIADILTALDDKINLTERKLEQAKQFKKSLLQQMFV